MSSHPDKQTLVFRQTNAQTGRHGAVAPGNSAMKHLSYGRIRLNDQTPRVAFDSGGSETGLVCLSGSATVTANGEAHALGRYDAIYIPRGAAVEVVTDGEVDFVECSAPVEGDYPLQVVRYESDVVPNAALHFKAGGEGSSRTLNILIGKNVRAGRLMMGVTQSQPGHWTSWPPHEHAVMLEELYVYYDMPAPAFGIQFVYLDPQSPDEHAIVVRDGDAVLMPAGYHPNVSIPGHSINFLWAMAAHREEEDRQFGVVNVQPDFDTSGSGLEASQK